MVRGGTIVSNEVALILASHGNFAKEAFESAKMIVGDMGNTATLSLFPGTNLTDFVDMFEEAYERLDTENGAIIICDIFGGTPSNAAAVMLIRHPNESLAAYSGLNMGALLELSTSRCLAFSEIKKIIEQTKENYWKELLNIKESEVKEEDL